jgi:site-specific DNA-methyltransferase (adenine-specific)
MAWLTHLVCPAGGTVLDPIAGSRTTLAAAVAAGRLAIAIEQHQPYADLSVQRLTRPIPMTLGDVS